MNKRIAIFSFALALLVLCGCVARPVTDTGIGDPSGPDAVLKDDPVTEDPGDGVQSATITCRVVEEEDGMLTLAEFGGSNIFTLSTDSLSLKWQAGAPGIGEQEIEAGSLVDITFSGDIAESYPARLGGATALTVRADGYDDMCDMYLEVLEDLWEVDSGLNGGITELSVDLRETSLSASEQEAVAWVFGQEHGIAAPLTLSWAELKEESYLTGEEGNWWEWEKGCCFTITEKPMEGSYSLNAVTFDAHKWRSALGAYFFSDCTNVQSASGEWGDYQIGSVAIS